MSEAKMPELVLPTMETVNPEPRELVAEKAESSLDLSLIHILFAKKRNSKTTKY